METRQGSRQALVVARQAAEAAHPGKAALYDPSLRQQHKSLAPLMPRFARAMYNVYRQGRLA